MIEGHGDYVFGILLPATAAEEDGRVVYQEVAFVLSHDIRRVVAPMRDAGRGVVDGRTDLEGRALFRREVFPADVEAVLRRRARQADPRELSWALILAVTLVQLAFFRWRRWL